MSNLERVVRGFGSIGWITVAWQVAATTPEGWTAVMGALGCGFVALILAIGAITGVSPIRRDLD